MLAAQLNWEMDRRCSSATLYTMNKLLIFAALLSVAAAQFQCDTPPAWEGRIFEMSNSQYRYARMSYDSENLRKRIIEEDTFTDGERDAYDELFLHKEQMGYRLNLRTKECEKFKLTEPFGYWGLPKDARFDEDRVIGSLAAPGAGLEVAIYEDDTSKGFYAGEWIPQCLPVREFYFERVDRIVTHWDFFDLTLGIKDPNVFIPPPECQ